MGKVIYEFFGDLFTDLFHGIYNQQIEPQKAKRVIIVFATVAVATTVVFSGINYLSDNDIVKKPEIKKEIKKPQVKKDIKEEFGIPVATITKVATIVRKQNLSEEEDKWEEIKDFVDACS